MVVLRKRRFFLNKNVVNVELGKLQSIRCLDCGFDQYFCDDCANKNHEKKNYFHLLEMLKVNISIQIVFNEKNIEFKYRIGIASHWWLSQQTRNDETPSDKEKSMNYI